MSGCMFKLFFGFTASCSSRCRSDWVLDLTHPNVSSDGGWQYGHSFLDLDDQWSAEPSPQLQIAWNTAGAPSLGLQARSAITCVRRRRWVRLMQRCEYASLPFLQPDGSWIFHDEDPASRLGDIDGAEDYLSRARSLAGPRQDSVGLFPSYLANLCSSGDRLRTDDSYSSSFPSHADAPAVIERFTRASSELMRGIKSL